MCVRLSVCLSVSVLTAEPFDVLCTKFGTGIDLGDILDEFDVEGHRSKVKVTRVKNVISRIFFHLTEQIPNPGLWCNTM